MLTSTSIFIFIFVFIFGAIIGSFINVVGLRYRSGLGLKGRSFCPSCSKELRWFELVPILSFLFLRGRCRRCKTKISWQYPLVEIWVGLVFASLYTVIGLQVALFLALVVFCLYSVILIYDLRHKIIPDTLVYASIFFSLIYRIVEGGGIYDFLIGPILFAVFGFGWWVSQGRALGFGDAKLVLSIGLLLGVAQGLSAIVLAFWIGTAVTLPLVLLRRKSLTIKSEVPFAPFLIIGAWVSLIFELDLFHVLSFIN